jgi:hypothetical protein
MSRRQIDPLRPLAAEERAYLERVSRAHAAPAALVARAKAVLAVAAGQTFTAAARTAGRRSGDSVAQLVHRFNESGPAAIEPGHGGANRNGTPPRNKSASCAKCAASRTARRTERPRGR